MGTGAMAVSVPLKRLLPLTPVAVGAYLWLGDTSKCALPSLGRGVNAFFYDI